MISVLLVSGVIPLAALTFINYRIHTTLMARAQLLSSMTSKQRRDHQVSAVLFAIILVFLVCHSFKFFVNCYECFHATIGEERKRLDARVRAQRVFCCSVQTHKSEKLTKVICQKCGFIELGILPI